MDELHRIPGPGIIQSLTGQGGAGDGKPRLERRRRKKRPEDGAEDEEQEHDETLVGGADTAPPGRGAAPRTDVGEADPDDDDETRGKHVDVRA